VYDTQLLTLIEKLLTESDSNKLQPENNNIYSGRMMTYDELATDVHNDAMIKLPFRMMVMIAQFLSSLQLPLKMKLRLEIGL